LAVYKKAIRDKIPEIIRDSGHSCNIENMSDAEFLEELDKKLDEELVEYKENRTVEELVDIVEVIRRISELRGTSLENFEKIRSEKVKERGAFEKNLFLIDTSKD
tara:strand:- start:134 stop:448 length:315 start_codon:yes stop_codon:yes gene_type:complete